MERKTNIQRAFALHLPDVSAVKQGVGILRAPKQIRASKAAGRSSPSGFCKKRYPELI
jgi:hypothetical protein